MKCVNSSPIAHWVLISLLIIQLVNWTGMNNVKLDLSNFMFFIYYMVYSLYHNNLSEKKLNIDLGICVTDLNFVKYFSNNK